MLNPTVTGRKASRTSAGPFNYTNSLLRIASSLRAEIPVEELALLYGLDMEALTAAPELPTDNPEKRLAIAGIATLKNVRPYLVDRGARIRYSGESLVAPLVRIPTGVLSIEKERLATLAIRNCRAIN